MPLKTAVLFDKIKPHLQTSGAAAVKKVGAVFHFEIAESKGREPVVWTVDLKNGNGSIAEGKQGKADATLLSLTMMQLIFSVEN